MATPLNKIFIPGITSIMDSAGVEVADRNKLRLGAEFALSTNTTDPAAVLNLAGNADVANRPVMTVAAKVGDGVAVTVQVKDFNGVAVAGYHRLSVWLSDTANGSPIGQVTTGLTTTFTTGTLALTKLANMDFDILTDSAGKFVIVVTDTNGTQTRYVNVAMNGKVYVSGAVVTT